ncbi:hypothetical protein [Palleronia sp.]|uniref:hypothetical protein n=1 Tax=Palleronia sp. TaxID=1940284 RepID=UPI0035C7F33E
MPDLRQTIADHLAPHHEALVASETYGHFHKALKKLLRDPFEKETLFALLLEKQAEGVLKPCRNLGDRQNRHLDAWQRLVEAGPEDLKAYDDRQLAGILHGAWRDTLFMTILDLPEKGPDGKYLGLASPANPENIRATLETLPDTLAAAVEGGNMDPDVSDCDIACSITGERLQLEMRDWQPVLQRLDMKTGQFVEAEAISAGKPLRHMEMNLPTGELLLADWFRIPGFSESVEALAGDPGRDIEPDQGADEHTRNHFERAGLVHISVGNSCPTIYRDGEILRLGRIDEEALYNEAGEQIAEEPEQAGMICTDLWWATMADKQTIADILMRSDQHADRAAAEAAIDAYVEENWGVIRIQMEPGPLHVYLPSGHNGSEPDGLFVKAGLKPMTGLEEQIVLSRAPLAELDPDMVLETGFTQGDPATAEPAPEPEPEPESDLSL